MMMSRIFLLFLVLSLSFSGVAALKISSRVIVPFEPGKTFEGNVCVVPEKFNKIRLSPTGELAENIILEKTELETDGMECVPYTITLPENFDRPGIHKSGITAQEVPDSAGNAQIVALVGITHQIWVEVPYPGKYLEFEFYAENTEVNGTVPFRASLISKGEEIINEAGGTIRIYKDGEEIGRILTDKIRNIQPQSRENLEAGWNSSEQISGDYSATLFLEYDGIEDQDSAGFKLGSRELRIMDHTKEVYKKGIVPFSVTAESYWSEPISGAMAEVSVKRNGSELVSFETLTKTVQPWERAGLRGYLDTSQLELGDHDIDITLFYDGGEANIESTLTIKEENIVEVEQPSSITTTHLLLGAMALLAMIAMILVYLLLAKNNERKS